MERREKAIILAIFCEGEKKIKIDLKCRHHRKKLQEQDFVGFMISLYV